jgi:hypothetical protein
MAEEQGAPIVPEEAGGVVEAVLLDLPSEIGPTGPATPADVMFSVVPPKLESAKGATTAVPYPQDAVAVEKLLDLPFVAHGDLFHGWILHEETRLLLSLPASGVLQVCRRRRPLLSPVSTQRPVVFTCYLPIAGASPAVFSPY